MDFYDATAGKCNSIKSEKATKWIKVKRLCHFDHMHCPDGGGGKTYTQRAECIPLVCGSPLSESLKGMVARRNRT